jgi:hypothetical protein
MSIACTASRMTRSLNPHFKTYVLLLVMVIAGPVGDVLLSKGMRHIAELSARTFCTFPREFSSFRRNGAAKGRVTLISDTFLPSTRATCGPLVLPASPLDARARGVPVVGMASALHGHAAASTDGHLSHDADRLASTRVRRAAVARDVRSAGTASPVPKYISSGVCPRNAECGSTRLCSST